MLFIGIVGARKYRDKESVEALVKELPRNAVIVTSGCDGVCKWTWQIASECGMEVLVYKPDLTKIRARFEVPKIYYERNRELIQRCDFVHAFISEEGGYTGGTMFEIEYAVMKGKPVMVHWENGPTEIIYQYRFPFENDYESLDFEWQNFFCATLREEGKHGYTRTRGTNAASIA